MEKKVFIVKNPNRRKETDQYNVRVLQLDDILILMQLVKKEVFNDLDKTFVKEDCVCQYHIRKYNKLKQRHLSTFENQKEHNSSFTKLKHS